MEKDVEKKKEQIDYRPFLNKIMVCLMVLIAIMVLNTIALFLGLKDEKDNTNSGQPENLNYDVSMFEALDENALIERVTNESNSDMQVVYIGRETCGYCVKFLPALKQAQSEFGYKTIYLDITTVTEDGVNKITALNPEFFEQFGYTPMVALFKDGKFVTGHVGYMEYSEFKAFLEESGMTKK